MKALFLAVLFWAAFLIPAHAQTVCSDRTKLTLILEQSWGFTLENRGLIEAEEMTQIVELWTNEEGRFAIVVSDGRIACIMAAGTDWK